MQRPKASPRETPRRGRNPFLVGQRIAKGRSKLPLAVFLHTASGTFFPHGKKGGLSPAVPRHRVKTYRREGQAPPLHYDDLGKSGRSNDGFSQHHGIKKRGALVSVPLSGTGDGNRTRMAQCRGILSPLCLPVPPRRRTCVFYHPAPPASRGAPRKRPPSVLDGGLIFKLLRR